MQVFVSLLGSLLSCSAPATTALPPLASEHPYADMAHLLGTTSSLRVRGRLVEERGTPDLAASTPAGEASQDEVPNTTLELVLAGLPPLGKVVSDGEGYVDTTLSIPPGMLKAGNYLVDFQLNGASVGQTEARILEDSFSGIVVRSDVDLTYLDTHFLRSRDMLSLNTQNASARTTLPAMETVYSALRAGASGTEDRPLVFISGSPRFFKRVLEERMRQDGMKQDGLFLKAFDEITLGKLKELHPEEVSAALHEQIAYKLHHLLQERLELPAHAQELLLGDDSESDAAVYKIYQQITAGALKPADLVPLFAAMNGDLNNPQVDMADLQRLVTLAAQVQTQLGDFKPVQAIYINLTGTPNPDRSVADWTVQGFTWTHRGAWPLALDLWERGLISEVSVGAIKARLLALGQSQQQLNEAAQAGVDSGLLRAETMGKF